VFAISALARQGLDALIRDTFGHVAAARGGPSQGEPDVRLEDANLPT
jgi:hypothetical protein